MWKYSTHISCYTIHGTDDQLPTSATHRPALGSKAQRKDGLFLQDGEGGGGQSGPASQSGDI